MRNGNANTSVPTIDLAGNPIKPPTATGDLQEVGVFGRDPSRPAFDASGAIQSQLALMPVPNDFRAGDGLNTAGYTWNRSRPYDFDQFDIRFDHQFNSKHRASFVYSEQGSQSTNFIGTQRYPTAPGGQSPNETTTETFTLTSVLRPSLLSEFHAGVFRPRQTYNSPWTVAGTQVLPHINKQPYLLGVLLANSPINTSVGDDPSTRISPVYQAGDTVSWIHGRHAFKGGFEARFVSSAGYDTFNTMPRVALGAGGGETRQERRIVAYRGIEYLGYRTNRSGEIGEQHLRTGVLAEIGNRGDVLHGHSAISTSAHPSTASFQR